MDMHCVRARLGFMCLFLRDAHALRLGMQVAFMLRQATRAQQPSRTERQGIINHAAPPGLQRRRATGKPQAQRKPRMARLEDEDRRIRTEHAGHATFTIERTVNCNGVVPAEQPPPTGTPYASCMTPAIEAWALRYVLAWVVLAGCLETCCHYMFLPWQQRGGGSHAAAASGVHDDWCARQKVIARIGSRNFACREVYAVLHMGVPWPAGSCLLARMAWR